MEKRNEITEGVIWKQLLVFFFPILLGTFFQQLYNTADAVIVGRFVGKEALAAVGGSTATIISLLINLFVGISSGAGVVIAQFYGAKQEGEVKKAVHTSVALSLVCGVIMTVLGIGMASWMLRLIATPEDIIKDSALYLKVYFAGSIGLVLYNIGAGILRAVGDTKRPLIFLVISCLVNIVLDLLFIAGLGMGVFGAALATILSQFISAVLVMAALLRSRDSYRLIPKDLSMDKGMLVRVLRIGIPAGMQSNMYTISNLLVQSRVNSFGTDTVAAWTAQSKIDGFYWMIIGAFGIAITTFSSQNFGAARYDRIRRSVKVCMGMAAGVSLAIGVVYSIWARPLLSLFTDDAAVLDEGVQLMRAIAPFYITYVSIEILSGAIRGTGDSLAPMLLTCTGVCVLRIIWVLVMLPIHRSHLTVAAGYPVTWIVTSILFIIYYLRGGWLRREIARERAAGGERKE